MDLLGLTVILPYGMTRIPSPVICLLWLQATWPLWKMVYTASGRDVTLQIWVEHGNQHLTEHAMASLKSSMRWDEDVYGLEYDLDLFQIVAVSHFNMGRWKIRA
ncbi:MAG: hypothetical protein CM15mP100_4940 [Alphaproteobacteria bacterium]|nr:MAG: hypothetical protein CM15mP100_4940 [Alphaproteobacteria bacterium]